MSTVKKEDSIQWPHGMVPLSRGEVHDKVIEMIGKESRGKILDVPTGAGAFADRLSKLGFEVSCCDINPYLFSVPHLKIEMGDLNRSLPYPDQSFDYVVCLEGIEHTENPSNAIREFSRLLKKGGKLYLSTPNFLTIERRLRFLFMGTFSKIPSHEAVREIWKGDIAMAHISPLGYPLLKFIMEHHGFSILQVEKDRAKPRMKWLLPLVWLIRLNGFLTPRKRRELYRMNETLMDQIIMGGNTLILVGEKIS